MILVRLKKYINKKFLLKMILLRLKKIIDKPIIMPIKKSKANFIRKIELEKWNKELFLYHGSLGKNELQYKDERFIGLPLSTRNHYREIPCDLNKKLPFPNCCADAFQSQDVLEHIEPENIINCLNEIYRILKHKGFFRLSVPDYNSPFLKKRSIYNYKGEILGDVALSAIALTKGYDSEVYISHNCSPGDAHLWFPTYELVNKYISESDFAKAFSCEWIHANLKNGKTILKNIPENNTFNVTRCPPNDMRANGLPVSLIVDLVK